MYSRIPRFPLLKEGSKLVTILIALAGLAITTCGIKYGPEIKPFDYTPGNPPSIHNRLKLSDMIPKDYTPSDPHTHVPTEKEIQEYFDKLNEDSEI